MSSNLFININKTTNICFKPDQEKYRKTLQIMHTLASFLVCPV